MLCCRSVFVFQVASCTYFRYGMVGRQESLEALCILALNIIIGRYIYEVLKIKAMSFNKRFFYIFDFIEDI